jgi:cob(I)alamin adenosyltransferase
VIYTKKGDKGKTSLIKALRGDYRVSKADLKLEAIGAVDELNSYLGVIRSVNTSKTIGSIIKDIQNDLFIVGSILGGSNLRFYKTKIIKLEKIIDDVERKLPVLKKFIFPRGTELSSHLHYARSLARKVERRVVGFNKSGKVNPNIIAYLNRLSDMLFMLARKINDEAFVKEELWDGK